MSDTWLDEPPATEPSPPPAPATGAVAIEGALSDDELVELLEADSAL